MAAAAICTVAALSLPAPAAAQSVKAGIEAWQSGDHSRAVVIWRQLAEAGDADAAFNLGQAYRLGRGVPANLAAAQTWLERAAKKDHVDAQTMLGLLLFQNGNRKAGLDWLAKASDKGEPRAMLIYGTALFNGDDVPRDAILGYALVSRAAAQGLAVAKDTLADMDSVLTVKERQQGVAIALRKARGGAAQETGVASATAPAADPRPGKAASAPAASGGWRIQLGAFAQRTSAETLFKRLSGAPPVAGRKAFYVAAGAVTRLQVGPFESRPAALRACAQLAASNQACFPVGAR